jgi:hypothetical protein
MDVEVKLPSTKPLPPPVTIAPVTQNFNFNGSEKEASLNASKNFRLNALSGLDRANRPAFVNYGDPFEKRLQTPDRPYGQLSRLPQATQQKIVDQIRTVVQDAKNAAPAGKLVFRLDPPELGAVTVKISQRGDQVFARIIPESSEVEGALRERAREIVNLLAGSGVKSENIHLSIGRESADPGNWSPFTPDRGTEHQSGRRESSSSGSPSSYGWQQFGAPQQSEKQLASREAGGWVA